MKKSIFICSCLILLLLPTSISAEHFPSKPVTLLVGFDRGGTMYSQAEVIADTLADILEQPVNLQVLSGLGGAVAVSMVAQSQSEGYIVLFTPSTPLTNPADPNQVSFQLDDFRYLASISENQNALVTYGNAPFSSWDEFLDYAKQQDEIFYASQNITDRYRIKAIAEQENINIRVIPVSGGAGMAPLVLAEDVDIAFSGGTHNRYVDTGQMKVIASLNTNRLLEHPDIPTLIELGYPSLFTQALRILAVPKNTPDHQYEILQQALKKAVNHPDFIHTITHTLRHPLFFMYGEELDLFLQERRKGYLNMLNSINDEN